jgi:hypothetical protein
LRQRIILPALCPFRVLSPPVSAIRRVRRTSTPLKFLVPPTVSLAQAPYAVGRQTHPGSARRFSQPLSGFQANTSFAVLFRTATVPGILPSECSPRENRAPLSRPLAPLQLSTSVLNRTAQDLITAGFPDSRTCARSPCSPDDYELPFVTPKRASRSPWVSNDGTDSFRQLHPLRSLDPPTSPFTSARVAPEGRSLLSWVSAPPEHSPSTPRFLNPPRHET